MRRLLLVLPFVVAGCGEKGPDDPAQYREAVRCANAASVYAQQFVVSGDPDSFGRLMGYTYELKARAVALGRKLGEPENAVGGDTRGAKDAAYVRKFFSFSNAVMVPTDFGSGEISHCNLDQVLK